MSDIFKAVDRLVSASQNCKETGGIPSEVLKDMQGVIDELSLAPENERESLHKKFRSTCEPGSVAFLLTEIIFSAVSEDSGQAGEAHLANY